jgi:undecaprenyl-diphosphatase
MDFDVFAITLFQLTANPLFDFIGGLLSIIFIFWIILGFFIIVYELSRKKPFFSAAYGLIITGIIVELTKAIVQRPRPELSVLPQYVTQAYSTSFPSGHTASAFLIAAVVSHYYPKYAKFLYPLAIIVGLSRMYLGVHYLTDVIAGAVIGIVVGLIVIKKEKAIFYLEAKINKATKSIFKR